MCVLGQYINNNCLVSVILTADLKVISSPRAGVLCPHLLFQTNTIFIVITHHIHMTFPIVSEGHCV